MEFCEGGNLLDFVYSHEGHILKEDAALKIFA